MPVMVFAGLLRVRKELLIFGYILIYFDITLINTNNDRDIQECHIMIYYVILMSHTVLICKPHSKALFHSGDIQSAGERIKTCSTRSHLESFVFQVGRVVYTAKLQHSTDAGRWEQL